MSLFPLSAKMKELSPFDSNGTNVFGAYAEELDLREKVIMKLAEFIALKGGVDTYNVTYDDFDNTKDLEQIIQQAVKEVQGE